MPLDADTIVDRRRLRRKLTFWRVLAFVVIILAVLGTVFAAGGRRGLLGSTTGSIARLTIQGLIRGDTERVESIDRLGRSSVKAVVVHIDSPGGTTAGSEQLHDALRRLAQRKPMVVVVDGLAASGGYIAAMAADHIVAQDTSLVGSVGVLFQYPNFTDLLKAGIRGVEAGASTNQQPRIMIHIDRGGDKRVTKYFFDKINSYGVPFDVIGQSYYPWWHGSLLDLRENLIFMANEYHKDIILVEVAYCWRPTEYKQRNGPFPETPEGQRAFLDEVNRLVMSTPDGHGIGIFWWEPAVTGGLRSRGFFADDGNALPVIEVFDRFSRR